MSDPIVSRHVSDDGSGRLVLSHAGAEAELVFTRVSPDEIRAERTFVPDALRGTGAGKALVAELVAEARSEKAKITSRCWFVDLLARRRPDWADAFAASVVRKDETNS